ncbi:ATP-binding protein [Streptomyces sp. NPDC096176]|uniref:ATP-binding protein n=1 Tax=Streptomyces sp. NPDC096176 TaxID=3366079 RepID=UPI0037F3ED67
MNQEITRTGASAQALAAAPALVPAPVRQFTVLLSATRRGARLARRLTVAHLADWGLPYGEAAQIVGELAANAVTHGLVPGRDFRLGLSLGPNGALRIEVTDACGERLPEPASPGGDAVSGRGLLLVSALADRWGVVQGPAPCKTVWAEMARLAPVEPEQGCRDAVERVAVACEVKE